MEAEKRFRILIAYFRYSTLFALFFCILCTFFLSFDPFGGLESMILLDLYGSVNMPETARPLFNFAFLLFCLASVLLFVMQYYIVMYALSARQPWAYRVLVICILLWLGGASAIAWYCQVSSYFVSVGMMALMYVPALLLLKRYF